MSDLKGKVVENQDGTIVYHACLEGEEREAFFNREPFSGMSGTLSVKEWFPKEVKGTTEYARVTLKKDRSVHFPEDHFLLKIDSNTIIGGPMSRILKQIPERKKEVVKVFGLL